MLGFGAVIPMLPVYLRDNAHASAFLTGVLVGIASAAALAGRVLAGQVADRKGRGNALTIGMFLCAAGGLLYLPFGGLWSLTAARLLHGLGEGFFMTASVAWVLDIAPAHRRSQSLGFLASGIWGGVSVGPVIGQALGTLSHVAWFLTLSSLAVLVVIRWVPEPPLVPHKTPPRLFPKPILLPGLVLCFSNVTYAVMSGFLILLLRDRGHGAVLAFSVFAVSVVFGRGALGSLPDRLGPRRALFAGLTLMAAGNCTIALTHSIGIATAASAITGLGYAFPWPSLAVIVVDRVEPTEKAVAVGGMTAFYDVAVAGGSAAAGAIAGHWGYAAAFWLAVGSAIAAAFLLLVTGLGLHHKPGQRHEIVH
jgi:MFS family permease